MPFDNPYFFSCYFDFFCLFLLHPFCLQSHSPIIFLFAVTLLHNFFFPSTPSPKFWSALPLTHSAFVTYFTCCAYISINIYKDNFQNQQTAKVDQKISQSVYPIPNFTSYLEKSITTLFEMASFLLDLFFK